MSLAAITRFARARPGSLFQLSAMLRLLVFRSAKYPLRFTPGTPSRYGRLSRSASRRAALSILITSAPKSANSFVVNEPAPIHVKSAILIPFSGRAVTRQLRRQKTRLGYLDRTQVHRG